MHSAKHRPPRIEERAALTRLRDAFEGTDAEGGMAAAASHLTMRLSAPAADYLLSLAAAVLAVMVT